MAAAMRIGAALRAPRFGVDDLALFFVALPNVIFLGGWIVAPWGWSAAAVLAACVFFTVASTDEPGAAGSLGGRWWLILAVAIAWCVIGGIGHFVYANIDWFVRDAVVVDLVRNPWPVRYESAGQDYVLRSAIGFYLPPALIGKLTSIRFADLALLAWTIVGVAITFGLLLRDRPSWAACGVRLLVFVLFSGMDIIPTIVRGYPAWPGAFIEWWARLISFQSQSTSLFWAPNHTLCVWIATAYLASRPFREVSIPRASLFVVLSPLSSPIAALALALYVGGVIVQRFFVERVGRVARELFDLRVLVVVAVCLVCVYPYLLSGSGEMQSGFFWDVKWVGEDFVPRYIEFVLVEFVLVSIVLLLHRPKDPLLWLATLGLLALPIYRFGPYDDLAMRGSITGLEVLAIRLGTWMGEWTERRTVTVVSPRLRVAAVGLFVVGAVTPLMEISRPFVEPRWPMDTQKSIVEVTRGAWHYITPDEGRWLRAFLKPGPAMVVAGGPEGR